MQEIYLDNLRLDVLH